MEEEKEPYPSTLAERFQVRLPPGLRDEIKAAAEANGRSMNAEIIARLRGGQADRRERIATAALVGILSCFREYNGGNGTTEGRARVAVIHADALIAELDKAKP